MSSKLVIVNRSKNTFINNDCTVGDRHNLTNAQYFGPGTWHLIHAACLEADMKPENINNLVWLLNTLLYWFPCPKCREHFTQYISEHPLPSRLHNKIVPIASIAVNEGVYFKWSVDFHNAVTARTSAEQNTSPSKCLYTVDHALSELLANQTGFGCEKCNKS